MMHWLRPLFTRRQIYSDLSEEIQRHLAEKVEALMAGGMSRKDVEYAARREFGNIARIEESGHEPWMLGLIATWIPVPPRIGHGPRKTPARFVTA
jgi:hypothetical protein